MMMEPVQKLLMDLGAWIMGNKKLTAGTLFAAVMVLLVVVYCIYLIPGVRGNAPWMYDVASLGFIPLPKYHGEDDDEVVEGMEYYNK